MTEIFVEVNIMEILFCPNFDGIPKLFIIFPIEYCYF
jgi:hypothetical protein